MDNPDHQLHSKTISKSGLPERVLILCDGLFRINSDFFDLHLQMLLNDLESSLFKNMESSALTDTQYEQSGQFSQLRNLQRTRHDFIPRFLAAIEQRLACIRSLSAQANYGATAKVNHRNMELIARDAVDETQIQLEIASRCESQHSFDIFLLGQRFGVLANQPAFDADHLPLAPRTLCQCLQEAIECLDLHATDKVHVYYLFERHVFTHYADLISACNLYLIDNGVLSNLTYVPFRNPELRHRKSPMGLLGKTQADRRQTSDVADENGNVIAFTAIQAKLKQPESVDGEPARLEESFTQLRQLLARRKQLLNKLSSYTSTYTNHQGSGAGEASQTADATHEQLRSIIRSFQQTAVTNPHARASIQHLKHDLLAQLRNQSTHEREFALNDEDSDAIDLVGLVMDNALKDVSPNSAASQLISMMQSPLIHAVLQDKSFFSSRIHPARQVLNILAEAGFNWLDENSGDDAMHEQITAIVNKAVKDYDGDNQEFIHAYEETNGLLQALIKKAEAAERRQIEAARGKERLTIARNRAALVMAELPELNDIPAETRALLNKAWTDVMALTELRQGHDSAIWQEQKSIAERIIAINEDDAKLLNKDDAIALKNKVQDSLSDIGYHQTEAKNIAETLIFDKNKDRPNLAQIPDKVRFGEHTQSANIPVYALNEQQLEFVEQIQAISVGTWFEFIIPDVPKPVRRKLAWQSLATHTVLFVNQRGMKSAEMSSEALAIELSEGRARIQVEDRKNIIERAFDNVLASLRSLLPPRTGDEP